MRDAVDKGPNKAAINKAIPTPRKIIGNGFEPLLTRSMADPRRVNVIPINNAELNTILFFPLFSLTIEAEPAQSIGN
ncbi:MAG: hypothetical protein EOO88_63290 [Pedobacter sp.]|nr:MAG: hypothetical protein EOO88_63290 [Pedobacter sp.]